MGNLNRKVEKVKLNENPKSKPHSMRPLGDNLNPSYFVSCLQGLELGFHYCQQKLWCGYDTEKGDRKL